MMEFKTKEQEQPWKSMGFYVQIKHKDMVNAKVQIWRLRPSLADTSPTNATGSGLSPGHRLRPPVQARPMPPAQATGPGLSKWILHGPCLISRKFRPFSKTSHTQHPKHGQTEQFTQCFPKSDENILKLGSFKMSLTTPFQKLK